MATFSVRFLGCKVSQTDAQQVRERLLADGHTETGEGAAGEDTYRADEGFFEKLKSAFR